MRVVLHLHPDPLELHEVNSGLAYPYLSGVGELRTPARAGEPVGIEGTESSTLSVTFDNRGKTAAKYIGRPLRIKADVYDDSDVLQFSGRVSSIQYRRELTMDIDA